MSISDPNMSKELYNICECIASFQLQHIYVTMMRYAKDAMEVNKLNLSDNSLTNNYMEQLFRYKMTLGTEIGFNAIVQQLCNQISHTIFRGPTPELHVIKYIIDLFVPEGYGVSLPLGDRTTILKSILLDSLAEFYKIYQTKYINMVIDSHTRGNEEQNKECIRILKDQYKGCLETVRSTIHIQLHQAAGGSESKNHWKQLYTAEKARTNELYAKVSRYGRMILDMKEQLKCASVSGNGNEYERRIEDLDREVRRLRAELSNKDLQIDKQKLVICSLENGQAIEGERRSAGRQELMALQDQIANQARDIKELTASLARERQHAADRMKSVAADRRDTAADRMKSVDQPSIMDEFDLDENDNISVDDNNSVENDNNSVDIDNESVIGVYTDDDDQKKYSSVDEGIENFL
jgi:hypothetical protein